MKETWREGGGKQIVYQIYVRKDKANIKIYAKSPPQNCYTLRKTLS